MSRLIFQRKPSLPLILQDEISECGHACVAMIGQYFGHRLNLATLRRLQEPSSLGINLKTLQELCQKLQLNTRALKVPLNELKHVVCPAILHWNMNHFVVLKKIRRNKAIIYDPAFGIKNYKLEELSQHFTGIVLELSASSKIQNHQDPDSFNLFGLFAAIPGISRWILMIFICSLAIDGLQLINPLLIQYITDHVSLSLDLNQVLILSGGVTVMMILSATITLMRGSIILYLSHHLSEQLSTQVMQHLLQLPLNFFEKRHLGDIQSKFQSIDQIQQKISTDLVHTLLDGLMILLYLAIMFKYNISLTVWILLALLLNLTIRTQSFHALKADTQSALSKQAKTASIFIETLQSILPLKIFLKESMRLNIWRDAQIDARNTEIKRGQFQLSHQLLYQCISHLEYLIILYLGAQLILSHEFSTGMLVAFLSFRLSLNSKAALFLEKIFDYQLIRVQINRLSDIVMEKQENSQEPLTPFPLSKGSLSISNLAFIHPQAKAPLFQDLHLTIEPGEKIAIIGPSGCGKTTLMKILLGLIQPSQGGIKIDEIPLQQFGLKHYRQLTAAVMQDDSLFSGSLIDNISFFDECVDFEQVIKVCRLAQIHEQIIQMPMGYQTLIGDRNASLSGGQKQRILLARALYKKPKFLFLDEASSHLDLDCERQINEALKKLTITQIIIAHRPDTIAMADRIIDLSEFLSNKVDTPAGLT